MKSEYAIRKKIRELKNSLEELYDFELHQTVGQIDALEWILTSELSVEGFEKRTNPDGTEGIWEIYREGNNSKKAQAKQKWEKMDKYSRDLALKYAKRFITEKPFDTWHPPALIVYLNQQRWTDVIEQDEIRKEKLQPQKHDEIDNRLNDSWK